MKRDLDILSNQKFDVIVIGGGIYGACVAWDSALRGLSVALIEKEDFGHATSSNSLKIIHGGLRYLQDANLIRARAMAFEKSIWLRIAPHLVQPIEFLTPTYKGFKRSKMVFSLALTLNELIGYNQDHILRSRNQISPSRVISREECLQMVKGHDPGYITGGAIWYDAQIYNSERLLISIILSASQAGAKISNYVEAIDFIQNDLGVIGITAKDVFTNQTFDILADMVVNCAGGWAESLVCQLGKGIPAWNYFPSIALNVVSQKKVANIALGLEGSISSPNDDGKNKQHQMLFFVPWRDYTIIGTKHLFDSGQNHDKFLLESMINEFIKDINKVYPESDLNKSDLVHVHVGSLPSVISGVSRKKFKLLRESQIHDHQKEDGIAGLITLIGVKYTTARMTAQKAVDLVVRRLKRNSPACRTHEVPIVGGEIENMHGFLLSAKKESQNIVDSEVIEHLVHTYGSEYSQILAYLERETRLGERVVDTRPQIKAEIIHAVREEMAQKLSDVVRRRTEYGAVGLPESGSLQDYAEIMARELKWSLDRKKQEVDDVVASYPWIF